LFDVTKNDRHDQGICCNAITPLREG